MRLGTRKINEKTASCIARYGLSRKNKYIKNKFCTRPMQKKTDRIMSHIFDRPVSFCSHTAHTLITLIYEMHVQHAVFPQFFFLMFRKMKRNICHPLFSRRLARFFFIHMPHVDMHRTAPPAGFTCVQIIYHRCR